MMQHAIDVWLVELGDSPPSVTSVLSPDELDVASRRTEPRARSRFVGGRSCLRDILASYLSTDPRDLTFGYGSRGKPFLVGGDLHFSVSYSGSTMVAAVTRDAPVGIDIEGAVTPERAAVLASRTLSARERRWLDTKSSAQIPSLFTLMWTRKEAVAKGVGDGLHLPFDQVETPRSSCAHGERARVQSKERWFLWDLVSPTRHTISVATQRRRAAIRCSTWAHAPAAGSKR